MHLLLGRKFMTNLDSILKSWDITLPTKVCLVKAMVFPVVMFGCELDCEESWPLKNWCLWTVVLEKTLVSPLDCKEIQPVHPKGDQSWVFIGRTDTEAETPILWPPHVKSWLIGKDPDAGKDWRWEEKGTKQDEMVGWHHRLNGPEALVMDKESWHAVVHGVAKSRTWLSNWTELNWESGDWGLIRKDQWVWVYSGSWWWTGRPGMSPGDSWGHKESDTTEQLNWTELKGK